MKSNILLSTTLASLMIATPVNADKTKIKHDETPKSSLLPPKTQDTLQGISNALKYALQPFPQEFHELPDDTESEIIVLESKSKMGLREIKTTPQLVNLDDIDTGPKVNRVIKAKLGGRGPEKKKFKK